MCRQGWETLGAESEGVCSIIGILNSLGRISATALQLGRPLGLLLSLTSAREKVKAEDGPLSPVPGGGRYLLQSTYTREQTGAVLVHMCMRMAL